MTTNPNTYVFLYHGYDTSRPELEQAWHDWFEVRAEHFVDPGRPFGPGREITPTTATDLTADDAPAAGYSIVRAASLQDAERLLDGCPIVDSCRIYETIPV